MFATGCINALSLTVGFFGLILSVVLGWDPYFNVLFGALIGVPLYLPYHQAAPPSYIEDNITYFEDSLRDADPNQDLYDKIAQAEVEYMAKNLKKKKRKKK